MNQRDDTNPEPYTMIWRRIRSTLFSNRAKLDRSFCEAIETGDLQAAAASLDYGADVNAAEIERLPDIRLHPGDWTGLHLAVTKNDVALGTFLIDHGANVDIKPRVGWTPLTLAANQHSHEMAAVLLERGADPNATGGPFDTPPILHAAGDGDAEMVRLLLANGATPIMAAVKSASVGAGLEGGAHERVIQQLLDAGADIDPTLDRDWSPRMWAAYQHQDDILERLRGTRCAHIIDAVLDGDMDMVRSFLENGQALRPEDHDRTPLVWAACTGRTDIMQCLINAGADVSFDGTGQGLSQAFIGKSIEVAASGGYAEAVQLLMEHGATIDESCIEAACSPDNTLMVDWLLEQAPEHATTALHLAVVRGDFTLAAVICTKYDVDVNPRRWSRTPLMVAASKGDVQIAALLIEEGADVQAANSDGLTALHFALWGDTSYEDPEAVKQEARERLASMGDEPIIRALLKHGAKIE